MEAREAGDDGRVVRERAVAVELDEVVEQALHVVERVRPVLVASELDRVPYVVGARLRRDPLDLPRSRAISPSTPTPQKRAGPQLGEPLAQSQLLDLARLRLSLAGLDREEGEDAAEVRAQLGRRTIASTWPKRLFDSARPKSSSFSRVVCWTTRDR